MKVNGLFSPMMNFLNKMMNFLNKKKLSVCLCLYLSDFLVLVIIIL